MVTSYGSTGTEKGLLSGDKPLFFTPRVSKKTLRENRYRFDDKILIHYLLALSESCFVFLFTFFNLSTGLALINTEVQRLELWSLITPIDMRRENGQRRETGRKSGKKNHSITPYFLSIEKPTHLVPISATSLNQSPLSIICLLPSSNFDLFWH